MAGTVTSPRPGIERANHKPCEQRAPGSRRHLRITECMYLGTVEEEGMVDGRFELARRVEEAPGFYPGQCGSRRAALVGLTLGAFQGVASGAAVGSPSCRTTE